MYKLQSIHTKQKQKQIMHESNKLCMLQAGLKSTSSLRSTKNKSNFVKVMGDKFAMSIKWGIVTINFVRTFSAVTNYPQLII